MVRKPGSEALQGRTTAACRRQACSSLNGSKAGRPRGTRFQIELSTHEDEPAYRLEGELTIYSVAEARDQLCSALDQHPALQLNLSGIEELDTAGVQLLAWLKQEGGCADCRYPRHLCNRYRQ
jgi:hypothetical protein